MAWGIGKDSWFCNILGLELMQGSGAGWYEQVPFLPKGLYQQMKDARRREFQTSRKISRSRFHLPKCTNHTNYSGTNIAVCCSSRIPSGDTAENELGTL